MMPLTTKSRSINENPLDKRLGWKTWFFVVSPILLALLIMVPRLLSAQFGLFDDGMSLRAGDALASGKFLIWNIQAGRFRPMYWLLWGFPYVLAGKSPVVYFLVNTILLVVLTGALVFLVRLLGGSEFQAWATAVLFISSGSSVENSYTLSKGESIQVFWLLASLIFAAGYYRVRHRRLRLFLFLGMSIAILFAAFSKETTLVMLPISVAWLGIGFAKRRISKNRGNVSALGAYFIAVCVGLATFFLLRAVLVGQGLTEAGYGANYEISLQNILASMIRWAGWLIRDFFYLIPLLILALLMLIREKEFSRAPVVLASLIWMAAWMAIFLPWTSTVGYFLLPFSFGASFFAGGILDQACQRFFISSRIEKAITIIFILMTCVLLLATLLNGYMTGRMQLAVDSENAKMTEYLAESLPFESLVLVNIQDPNEYVTEIRLHLNEIYERPDLQVDTVDSQTLQSSVIGPSSYILTPFIDNQPLLTVRMGVVEQTQSQWNDSLKDFLQGQGELIYHEEAQFRLINLNLPKLFCIIIPNRRFCVIENPFFDHRLFTYGWKVYRVIPQE